MIEASVELGAMLVDAMAPHSIQSFGKGGIVGYGGEQEHANALLTSAFANPIRQAIGGAEARISSMTKIGEPGTLIDISMNHKDESRQAVLLIAGRLKVIFLYLYGTVGAKRGSGGNFYRLGTVGFGKA